MISKSVFRVTALSYSLIGNQTPNFDRFETIGKETFDTQETKAVDNALKSLYRLIKSNKRNKDLKPILYRTLMILAIYVDIEKNQRMRLKELLQFLVQSNNIENIMEDLQKRMVRSYENSNSHQGPKPKI